MIKGLRKLIRTEHGSYAVLSACVITALITFAGYSLNSTYARSVTNELQAAADAASHAAAKALCASEECWDNARDIAFKVIFAQLYEQMTGELSSTCPLRDVGGGASGGGEDDGWNACAAMQSGADQRAGFLRGGLNANGFFNIKNPIIERGRWTPEQGFESVEGTPLLGGINSWQNEHPGEPRTMVANAVRVKLTREHITIVEMPFEPWNHSVSVEAVAVADTIKEEKVAPFAIPVCALMELNGAHADFQRDISKADRLFTRADRYCPSGDCDTLPAFPYGTCENDPARHADDPNTLYLADSTVAQTVIDAMGLPFTASEEGHYCLTQHMKPLVHDDEVAGGDNWALHNRQGYSQIWNHYGVVGLPEGAGGRADLTEAEVQDKLTQALVDRVDINARIGEPYYILPGGLSSQIAGNDIWSIISGSSAPNEDRISVADSGMGTVERNLNFYYASPGHGAWLNDMTATKTIHNQGLCKSMRLEINTAGSVVNGEEARIPYSPRQASPDDVPVWRIKVPVIADVDADERTTCPGLKGVQDADDVGTPPNPDHRWEIVGFVTAEIFDVSIGEDAPRATDDVAAFPAGYPYGFETDDNLATRERCNAIRARIVKETNFIAGSNTDKASRRPLLISRSDY
ncbi:MAG: hypothetical protein KDD66_14705 [Bdellovibrionales bacterium]|nr:hypothetical protein [Bdellovibrionales bacterium]